MQDPSILRDAIDALKADEGDQQKAQLAASRTRLEDGGAVTGNPQGDVTIVEFFDTRCPYCRKLEPVMAKLLAQDHGVRLVYKDLPILGPPSVLGSKALLAAQRQGGYEQLRDAIMAAPPQTTKAMIKEAAEGLGLDWARLARDMDDPAIQTQIEAEPESGSGDRGPWHAGDADRRYLDARGGRSAGVAGGCRGGAKGEVGRPKWAPRYTRWWSKPDGRLRWRQGKEVHCPPWVRHGNYAHSFSFENSVRLFLVSV